MDFTLTEEQELLVGTAKEFAQKELRPWVRFIDEKGDQQEGHDKAREIYSKASDLGFTRMGYPEEYGGVKVDPLTMGLIAETLGRYGGVPKVESGASLFGASGSGLLVARAGTREQKEAWLPGIISGKKILAIGSTEPHCGSDLSQIKTTARREGDEYIIDGEKQMVSGVRWADAHLVYARTSEDKGARGISAIIVEGDRHGLSKYQFKTFGGNIWELGGIVYKDVKVPVSNRLGDEGKGFSLLMGMFDWMRAIAGAQCVGIAQGALDESIDYVKQRFAFGRPIGKWEGVQFRISEAATILEAARWLTYHGLWLAGQGRPHAKEASMVKWWVPTVTFNIVNDCLQNRGAMGYTTEVLDELRLRYIRALWIADGTIDIQKIIVGREILGKEFVPYR